MPLLSVISSVHHCTIIRYMIFSVFKGGKLSEMERLTSRICILYRIKKLELSCAVVPTEPSGGQNQHCTSDFAKGMTNDSYTFISLGVCWRVLSTLVWIFTFQWSSWYADTEVCWHFHWRRFNVYAEQDTILGHNCCCFIRYHSITKQIRAVWALTLKDLFWFEGVCYRKSSNDCDCRGSVWKGGNTAGSRGGLEYVPSKK